MTSRDDPTAISPIASDSSPTRLVASDVDNSLVDLITKAHKFDDYASVFGAVTEWIVALPGARAAAAFRVGATGGDATPVAQATSEGSTRYNISRTLLKEALASGRKTRRRMTLGRAGIGGELELGVFPIVLRGAVTYLVHLEVVAGGGADSTANHLFGVTAHALELVTPYLELLELRTTTDSWLVRTVRLVNAAIHAKDTYTAGHSERVARFATAIADALSLPAKTRAELHLSGLCHDIGKIGVPDDVLRKPDLLSADEFQEMRAHPALGRDIIRHMPGADAVMDGVVYHHEKWDGTGYPDGLAGDAIPLFGRIIAVADAFDAMVSGRSYSGYMDEAAAVTRLQTAEGLWDPAIVAAFVAAHRAGRVTLRTDTVVKALP